MEEHVYEYADLENICNHLSVLDEKLSFYDSQQKHDSDKIKELESICNERALIISTQQTSFQNLEFIIEKLQNQCEKNISDEVEKRTLLEKIINVETENFQLKEQQAAMCKDWNTKYNFMIEQYEEKIRKIINLNLEKESNATKSWEDVIRKKDDDINQIKKDLEFKIKEFNERQEFLKAEFGKHCEDLKSQYKNMNNFSPNVSSDFYRKKYEFLQIETDRRISELTNQLNAFLANEVQLKSRNATRVTSTQLAGRCNDKQSDYVKNQDHFVSAASLLEQDSIKYFYDNLSSDLPTNYSHNAVCANSKCVPELDDSLFVTPKKANDHLCHVPKIYQSKIPQKRRLFTINSVNNFGN